MGRHVIKKRDGKYRIMDTKTGKLARNSNGTIRDGGGHRNFTSAAVQASILNRVKK